MGTGQDGSGVPWDAQLPSRQWSRWSGDERLGEQGPAEGLSPAWPALVLSVCFKASSETKFRQTEKELKLNFPKRQLVAPWKERAAADATWVPSAVAAPWAGGWHADWLPRSARAGSFTDQWMWSSRVGRVRARFRHSRAVRTGQITSLTPPNPSRRQGSEPNAKQSAESRQVREGGAVTPSCAWRDAPQGPWATAAGTLRGTETRAKAGGPPRA